MGAQKGPSNPMGILNTIVEGVRSTVDPLILLEYSRLYFVGPGLKDTKFQTLFEFH